MATATKPRRQTADDELLNRHGLVSEPVVRRPVLDDRPPTRAERTARIYPSAVRAPTLNPSQKGHLTPLTDAAVENNFNPFVAHELPHEIFVP